MVYFNEDGRRAQSKGLRVFDEEARNYYQIKNPVLDYSEVLSNSIKFGGVDPTTSVAAFESACIKLKNEIANNAEYKNLLNGVHIPFIVKKIESIVDLGKDLEDIELPNFQKSFNAKYPDSHFKAVLQSNSKLPGNVTLDARSRYQGFLDAGKSGAVIGWYFPQALQEFDVESQRKQMADLPAAKNACLSGGIDILAALIGSPSLLINEDAYAPILCLSAYVHADPRLVLLIKSYGPHMEFWCMTQMLSKTTTQVSEQWSGGITFYAPFEV
jgi:hypothetical protein